MNGYLTPGDYLPHEAPMVLLEQVLDVCVDSARCRVTLSADGVLAPFLDEQGCLPAWYALELMAQTVGVWSGWHRHQQGEKRISLGMVLGARDLDCKVDAFPADATLDIAVHLLMQDSRFGSFEATISHQQQPVATGRINTFQPDDAELAQLFNQESPQ
ncbi:hotdog family protein [Atlantibacter hermannii]|uniref:hotdog family protein n=1 Tax=Atlantibacter hermannii TaxID=565 RepID=UPI0028A1CB4D|nr:hotdog family protein [Atlantibacter hermannii]